MMFGRAKYPNNPLRRFTHWRTSNVIKLLFLGILHEVKNLFR